MGILIPHIREVKGIGKLKHTSNVVHQRTRDQTRLRDFFAKKVIILSVKGLGCRVQLQTLINLTIVFLLECRKELGI